MKVLQFVIPILQDKIVGMLVLLNPVSHITWHNVLVIKKKINFFFFFTECQSQGCCWSPVNPNPDNIPYCFHSNPIAEGYQVVSQSTSSTGASLNLTVLDSQNQQQYGTPITNLAVQVDYVSSSTLHVKIYGMF